MHAFDNYILVKVIIIHDLENSKIKDTNASEDIGCFF
jgi:hypothetical protein